MVRLKAGFVLNIEIVFGGFNSMMVRLKADEDRKDITRIIRFQFHDGAIKGVDKGVGKGYQMSFNSMMVRLKVETANAKRSKNIVSIP